MKKIYILSAVFALLTLSLNAQITKQVVEKATSTENVNNDEKVVTPPDGYFRVGPSRASSTPVTPPYTNGFNSQSEWDWWETIDVAGDGTSWGGQWTLSNNTARYTYDSDNAADDWLITAPITLKAGRTYKFYLDTWANGYTERIEVKMASGHTASALSAGATVIAAQNVTSSSSNPTHLSNESITVDADGDYYFGIHAISIADRFYLFVDNFEINVENTDPKIVVSPETLTISDSGTNNTFTVQGTNLVDNNNGNVGVSASSSDFGLTFSSSTNTIQSWGFERNNGSVNGTVAVNYYGRALNATTTVTAATQGDSKPVEVTYVPDLYIVGNFASDWNYSADATTPMTNNGDGTYTATLSDIPANSYILFSRKIGETYNWDNNRFFIGAVMDNGQDWEYGINQQPGALDVNPNNPSKYRPIHFSEGGSYTVTIDANAYTFTIDKLVLPPPENVEATPGNNLNATVTWDAPSNLPTVKNTEGFEDTNVFPPFTTGGVTATQHTGAFGDWTLYDATGGCVVYGSTELVFENEGQPQAWFVFRPSGATPASGYETSTPHAVHSGEQYLESICPTSGSSAGGVSDHWLISPELSGNAQTISFYGSALTTRYIPETYEIWVSTTDNDPSSFTQLGNTYSISVSTWVEQTVDLPAGTKYFAIRHTSNDRFALLIDDVTYEGVIKPESYNVYLDGEPVGSVDAADPLTYDFNNLTTGEHTVEISAVYPGDIESEKVADTFTIMEKTATPTIEMVTNSDGSKTITAVGDGTVHLYIDGVEQTNPYTIMPSTDGDITVTVTATAQEEGKLISDPATETVTVPEAGRSPMPTINMVDNGDGTYTITITGTGDLAVYINDAEHGGTAGDPVATGSQTVSFNVEQHSQTMTLTIQATNQEEGLAVSRTAEETYTIPAMSLDGFTPLNPQPANTSTPIDLSNLMFVDRFSKEIPATNDHPALYDYYLQETQVRQRTSNSVEVPVKHTGSDGLGYYTLSQLDNDVNVGIDHDKGLKMNVRNAAMDLPLEADPSIYFYTESRGTAAYPNQADRKWLAVLQHTTDGTYSETLNPSYDWGEVYPGGQHHIHYDMDTITGEYNDYLAYVPIVWTMGFDRVNYETDHTHNSYGAPRWKTGVAKVNVQSVNAERQTGVQGSTNWMEGSIPCSMYMIDEITAVGTMPSVNTMPYKPYMFRVFVESKNGKLRGYKKIGDGATINDATHYEGDGNGPQTGPFCIWSEYVDGSTCIGENGYEYTFSRGKISEVDSNDHWIVPDDQNIMFAAEDNLLTETNQYGQEVIQNNELNIFVRFYYIVEGADEGHTIPASGPYTGQRNRDGEAPGGYGSESPGASPSPSTAVNEISVGSGVIVSQTFYNVQGMKSDTPFDGINIVVTRYSDGTTRTTKVIR